MKNTFFALCLFAAYAIVSCTKGGTPVSLSGNTYTVSSSLNGAKVNPATTKDTTSGILTGWYDEETKNLTFTLSYVKDTSTVKADTLNSIQLYKQTPTTAGTVPARSFQITVAIAAAGKTNLSGTLIRGVSGNTQFSSEEETSFISSGWYVLVVSSKFPKGIIGGQINVIKNQ